jgi:hypothetical protein
VFPEGALHPVMEVFIEHEDNGLRTRSSLAGLIWKQSEELALDCDHVQQPSPVQRAIAVSSAAKPAATELASAGSRRKKPGRSPCPS